MIDIREQINLIALTNLVSTVSGSILDKLSCEINSPLRSKAQKVSPECFCSIFSDVLFKNLTFVSGNQIISIVTARPEKINYIHERQNV